MRAVIQRVKSAQVSVENEICGQIQHGMLILLGLAKNDDFTQGKKLLDKILAYRMFSDAEGKMSLNVNQVHGGVLLVSQFTLLANTQKGLRPDFAPAMPPSEAKALYDQLVDYARQQHPALQTGIFAADMQVRLINDGPVTFILESWSNISVLKLKLGCQRLRF